MEGPSALLRSNHQPWESGNAPSTPVSSRAEGQGCPGRRRGADHCSSSPKVWYIFAFPWEGGGREGGVERRTWGGEGDFSLPCILGGAGWEVSSLAGGAVGARRRLQR